MNISIRGYKRAGMALYYGALAGYTLADRFYHTDGMLTQIGRSFAIILIVIVFAASTGQQRLAALKAELDGAQELTFADALWARFEKVLFWFSIAAAAWFAFKGQFFDGLVSLGFPAWKLWLKLELRRLQIQAGARDSSGLWRVLLGFCAVSFLFALARSYFIGLGPVFPLLGDEYHLYPAIIIASLAGVIFSLLGSGGKI